jgi:hypothetical protein
MENFNRKAAEAAKGAQRMLENGRMKPEDYPEKAVIEPVSLLCVPLRRCGRSSDF